MKKEGHPTYYPKATVTCACGNKFTTGSTVEELHVEICSVCHPFYTGKQKLADERGRVDRFQKRMQKKSTAKKPATKAVKTEPTPTPKVTPSR
ncbi:MAG: 50S ribosomal protein L31 [Patescibacteria group bacterium]